MDKVIDGIEAGDPACILIGIEFDEQDQGVPFERILKSRPARGAGRPGESEMCDHEATSREGFSQADHTV
ncbi:MAG: hypothetical protein KF787_10095 [Phycisphaeraceae bacterium]|nr:hypothetical protein [Phycisphaerae bacterium]MBX3392984.1 hypothetical protein [Phycisphaeraceae bacterium]